MSHVPSAAIVPVVAAVTCVNRPRCVGQRGSLAQIDTDTRHPKSYLYIYKVRVRACVYAFMRASVCVRPTSTFPKRHDINTKVLVGNTSRCIRPRLQFIRCRLVAIFAPERTRLPLTRVCTREYVTYMTYCICRKHKKYKKV